MILKRDINFWIFFLLTSFFSGLFVYLNLYEFIKVGVLNETGAYPFGGEGDTSWYYETKDLYSTVSLISGIIFLMPFLFSIYTIIKNNKKQLLITFMVTLFFMIVQIINGQTG